MSNGHIECLGCHRNNPAGTMFCVYCRRKLRVAERPVAPVAIADALAPAKRSWWQKVFN